MKKRDKGLEKIFLQRRHTCGKWLYKKVVNVIREMPIKTTMRYHLTLVRKTIIKKTKDIKWMRKYSKIPLVGMSNGATVMAIFSIIIII
jgi:hypothetical protein